MIRRYDPRQMDARSLYKIVHELRGRDFHMVEKGGRSAPSVDNLTMMGSSILIMDEESVVEEILALLAELDRIESVAAEDAPQAPALRTLEFEPRYVSLTTIRTALSSYHRMVKEPGESSRDRSIENVTYVSDRSLVILRDEEERVDEMLRLLTRLDVPEEQVLITTWIAVGDRSWSENSGLPDDLVQDLRVLLPDFGFQADGYSVVRSSVAAGRGLELEIEGRGQDYLLSLRPSAYDAETGRLTLDQCQFLKRTQPVALPAGAVAGPGQTRLLFQTSAVLEAGDYTVLGASGQSPVFLVIKVEPLGRG